MVGWGGCKRFLIFFFLVSCLLSLNHVNIMFCNKYTGLNVNETKFNNHRD